MFDSKKSVVHFHSARITLSAFEGLDRSDKTTQAALLVERLQHMNIPVVQYRFPKRDETSSGEKMRQFLNSEVTLDPPEAYELFLEQRAEAPEEIKSGTVVILSIVTVHLGSSMVQPMDST